jgi:phosphatidylserine/phosphatidylglycerophosphate/cardiolipin synthase-like enzyme
VRAIEHREFRVGRLPARAQIAFARSSAPWWTIVDEAIEGGVHEPSALADLMFFVHHRDRVVGGAGRGIDPQEVGFHHLRAEWNLFRAMAARRVRPSAPCSVFLSEHRSASYEDRVAAPTTGRVQLFVHGRSAGPGGADQTGALDSLQGEVESLGAGDALFLAAWQLEPSRAPLPTPGPGLASWADLLVRAAEAGVAIRVLLGDVSSARLPASLDDCEHIAQRLPLAARDRFQYVASAHPAKVFDPRKLLDARTRLSPFVEVGAHHQRLAVLRSGRSTIAYCGPELAPAQAPPSWDAAPVWHDVHLRAEGLVAHDLELELIDRWNRERERVGPAAGQPLEILAERGPDRSARALARNPHAVQMQRTVSVGTEAADIRRDDIWLGYFQLIGCATELLFLETEGFQEPRLADAIVRQAEAQPELVVIIVASSEPEEPASLQSSLGPLGPHAPHGPPGPAMQRELFTRLAASISPARLGLYTMSGRRVRSNVLLVDDRALSIGSASATPRGFFLDTELNLVLEAPPVVQDLRHRLWAHDLAAPVTAVAAWRRDDFVAEWEAVARDNAARAPDQRVGEAVVPFAAVRDRAARGSGLSG